MSVSLKQACLDVANEIEAGTLVPGVFNVQNMDGTPCCVLGHLEHRSGQFLPLRDDRWWLLALANDNGNMTEVVNRLRDISETLE